MANCDIELTYFDFNGRAEIIRLLLTYAGKEFIDNRISREKWPEIKPTSPFGQVPFVKINGKTYGQSIAIANYFAREFGLYGKTNLDCLKIDQFIQLTEDLIQDVVKVFRETDAAKKAEIEKNIREVSVPKYLANCEKLLKQNNGKYFAGDYVSLASLVAYDTATGFLKQYIQDALKNFPLFEAVVEEIGSNERIKAYKKLHP